MSTTNPALDTIEGNEALSVGEAITTKLKEMSLGIDAFNAKNFNKSIHTVKGIEIWKDLSVKGNYFGVSIKHIPSPVFFDLNKLSFTDYVALVLKAVPIVKLVQSQADALYRSLKTTASTGRVPFSIRNTDALVMINQTRDEFSKFISDSGVYTRAVSEMYPNFDIAYKTMVEFNKIVTTLQSRDIEVLAKSADQVIYIANLLKAKLAESEIILKEQDRNVLNDAVNEMVDSITFAGMMVSQLNDLTRVLQLQCDEAKKL